MVREGEGSPVPLRSPSTFYLKPTYCSLTSVLLWKKAQRKKNLPGWPAPGVTLSCLRLFVEAEEWSQALLVSHLPLEHTPVPQTSPTWSLSQSIHIVIKNPPYPIVVPGHTSKVLCENEVAPHWCGAVTLCGHLSVTLPGRRTDSNFCHTQHS